MKLLGLCTMVVAGTAMMLTVTHHKAQADDDDDSDSAERIRVEQGFRIAPVSLTYNPDDRHMVGLGSYLVNAVGGCSDCHTQPSYTPKGNPFLGEKKQVNGAHYLGGGQFFGPFISRNLTPEHGLPGGRSYAEFKLILRTGIDLDHLHPKISSLLQVMPWPTYQEMSDHDLRAIYEYLKAIPPATPGTILPVPPKT